MYDEVDYNKWNTLKKLINNEILPENTYYHEREIWWCSIGVNIGIESNGKNNKYERPVLIIKKFGNHLFIAIPLTSKDKTGPYYVEINQDEIRSFACITQIRSFSMKRLIRKMGVLNNEDYIKVINSINGMIQ